MSDLNSVEINQEKSISALENMNFENLGCDKDKAEGLGLPIQSFENLMAQMTSMNIKFLN